MGGKIKNKKEVVRILLLGSGESGKSTFYKQIKHLYQKSIDIEEIEDEKENLKNNIIFLFQTLIEKKIFPQQMKFDNLETKVFGIII
jgi:ABC-type polar amino acid transport system ATPase subunit